ncbi:MAG: hypothetical protein L6R42_006456, partial [Xanthoria sp. 1 TBL-2021]
RDPPPRRKNRSGRIPARHARRHHHPGGRFLRPRITYAVPDCGGAAVSPVGELVRRDRREEVCGG